MKRIAIILIALLSLPLLQSFTYQSGRASLSPYPDNAAIAAYPDSLTPIFINHVGRHGSRYPAGSYFTMMIKRALDTAEQEKTITPLGKDFKQVVEKVIAATGDNWGQLDTIGEREHRHIATRMAEAYPELLDSAKVEAISSYSPRCIMSMYSFCHELTKKVKNIDVSTSSGKCYSNLMRNYELDEAYNEYKSDTAYVSTYNKFAAANIPIDPLLRILGENYPMDYDKVYDLALAQYYVAAGMNCMGLDFDAEKYFTIEEYKKLWSVFNFRQYLLYSASTLSSRPAEIAAPLLQDIIFTADKVLSGNLDLDVKLRFGHAETLMPLMALLQAPYCYYLTNYYDTVADNWKDYESFPMAANLQMIFFKAPSGKIYVRTDYNEKPIKLLHGYKSEYVEWDTLRFHLIELIPLS